MAELDDIDANLQFWGARAQRGRHFWFALLQQGPVAFVERLDELAHWLPQGHLQRRLLNQADLTERRVLIFRLLRQALAKALAQVQAAATLLYLRQTLEGGAALHEVVEGDGAADVPLHVAAREAVDACLAQIITAFYQLHQSAAEVLGPLPAGAGPGVRAPAGGPAGDAEDARVLRRTLSNLLGFHYLRGIFSRPELQGGGGGGEQGEGQEAVAAGAWAGAAVAPAAAAGPIRATARRAQAQAAVGFVSLVPAGASVQTALSAAHQGARRLHRVRLIAVPRWARMPSPLQQHWLQYLAGGAVATYALLFLYRHSSLAGSNDLRRWNRGAAKAVLGAWREHIVAPLDQVKNELFNTFRRRPTLASYESYLSDKQSLHRMLADFGRDYAGGARRAGSSPAAAAAAAGATAAAGGVAAGRVGQDAHPGLLQGAQQ